ncbi:hypothetical protein CB1_000775021 [Camelus ferus]|nr:hypothetical protein CB1_000775021 [Camelus ferus]
MSDVCGQGARVQEVFYSEVGVDKSLQERSHHVPLSPDTTTTEEVVGDLKPATEYQVSVAAYSQTGKGRLSSPRHVTTLPQDSCLPPAAPQQPHVTVVSDSEVALSWKPGEGDGSSPIQFYSVEFIRPDFDKSWTLIQEQIQMDSMVIKGLDPDTNYQFAVRAMNPHGPSPRSQPSNTIRTAPLWKLEALNRDRLFLCTGGQQKIYFCIILREFEGLLAFCVKTPGSQLCSLDAGGLREFAFRFKSSINRLEFSADVWAVMNKTGELVGPEESGSGHYGPHYITDTEVSEDDDGFEDDLDLDISFEEVKPLPAIKEGNKKFLVESKMAPRSNPMTISRLVPLTPPSLPMTTVAPQPTPVERKRKNSVALMPRLFDMSCDETLCSADSFCVNDYNWGGSRCHCNLGKGGESCSEDIVIQYPQFFGHSYVTFEPLKNSYQAFQITLEFRVSLVCSGILSTPFYSTEDQEITGGHEKRAAVSASPDKDLTTGNLRTGECSSGICDEASCINGGTCTASKADSYICLCPLGFRGRHCEDAFTLTIPQFRESLRSYATTPWPLEPRHYLSFMEFEITFRPDSGDGVLLYSYDTGSKDFLSINMAGSHVEFRFDCGSGTGVLRSEEPLTLGHWHELHVSRTAKNGILQVDKQKVVEGMAEMELSGGLPAGKQGKQVEGSPAWVRQLQPCPWATGHRKVAGEDSDELPKGLSPHKTPPPSLDTTK